jgi:hypothetical protein
MRVRNANTGLIKTVIKPIATTQATNQAMAFGRAASGSAVLPPAGCLPRPGIPAVNIGGKEEQLQKQAGVQLDLEEDNGKQRDVDQPECIVADLLQARQPDTQQPASVPTASIHDRS